MTTIQNNKQKITPFLWFNDQAEEAANFYVSIFKNSKIGNVSRYGDTGPGPKGSVMVVTFQLEGQEFMALNGGPSYSFTPAISFMVNCATQQEVDELWEKLTEGGKEVQCGWLTDKYGLSWQIVPTIFTELMQGKDPAKKEKMMQVMMQMVKLDSEKLKQAFEN
jgi:predicted 3-demethylubiquinone-9 3-methyltransferase (glyoxalase superfamily)